MGIVKHSGVRIRAQHDNNVLMDMKFTRFPITFGRGDKCHLQIKYSLLSRTHACFAVEDDQIVVSDLESTNGIFFNGQKVQTQKLGNSGEISVGQLRIHFSRFEYEVEEEKPVVTQITSETLTRDSARHLPSKAGPRRAFSEMTVSREELGLRAVLFWKDEIFDVRQFLVGDSIDVGSLASNPLVLPFANEFWHLGQMKNNFAEISLPHSFRWTVQSLDDAAMLVRKEKNDVRFLMRPGSLLEVQLKPDIVLQLGFAEIETPSFRPTWLENREEFQWAIRISSIVHSLILFLALFSAPKPHAPTIENVPVRFARLLVEPPKAILAPPPPPPPPLPNVEVVAEAEPPQKPKPTVKPRSMKKTHSVSEAPKASAADQMLSALGAFESTASHTKVDLKNVKIQTTAATADDSFSASSLMATIKSKNGRAPSTDRADINADLTKNRGKQFAVGGVAGTRDVKGQVVGRPRFSASEGPQGLTDKEVMAVVNKHVNEIQQCYERSLLEKSTLAGRVEYAWTISAKGQVTEASVKSSEIAGGDSLNDCVIHVLKGIVFPASRIGQPTMVSVGFPFGKR